MGGMRRVGALTIAAVLGLGLAACGDDGDDDPAECAHYSVRSAIVGSMLSARRVGTTQPSMQTPSMTIP